MKTTWELTDIEKKDTKIKIYRCSECKDYVYFNVDENSWDEFYCKKCQCSLSDGGIFDCLNEVDLTEFYFDIDEEEIQSVVEWLAQFNLVLSCEGMWYKTYLDGYKYADTPSGVVIAVMEYYNLKC